MIASRHGLGARMHPSVSNSALAASAADSRDERRAWYVVFVLFLAYALSFIDRQILTLMVEPIKRDLQLSDTQFSLLHGLAFALFYTFLGMPIGRLADQLSRVRIIAAGVLTWSLMTAGCGIARNYPQLFLARMGVGVGEAALSPAAFSIFSDLFSRDRLPRAISTYSMGIATGNGLALLLGGSVVAYASSLGATSVPGIGMLQPWQLVFILIGLAGVPLAFVILRLEEPVRRGVVNAKATVAQVGAFIRARRRFFLTFLPGLSIATALGHGVLGWGPAYFMRTYGWTPGEVGLRYGFGVLFGGVAGFLFGSWLTERLQRRGRDDAPLLAALTGIALCLPLGIAAPLSPNAATAVVLFSMLQFAYHMPWGVVGAAIQLVAPNEMRGQLSALYLFSINIVGLGFGPTFVALLTDRVYGGGAGVGYSLATAAAVLAPIASVLLIAALSGYRAAVRQARAWS